MKVIFLDIDGVLNDIYKDCAAMSEGGKIVAHIGHKEVSLVNRVIEATGAVVVISSNWRHLFPLADVASHLYDRGLLPVIIGCTLPSKFMHGLIFSGRAQSIYHWVDTMKPDRWCSIDDAHMFDSQLPASNLVHIKGGHGITSAHASQAIAALGRWRQ